MNLTNMGWDTYQLTLTKQELVELLCALEKADSTYDKLIYSGNVETYQFITELKNLCEYTLKRE